MKALSLSVFILALCSVVQAQQSPLPPEHPQPVPPPAPPPITCSSNVRVAQDNPTRVGVFVSCSQAMGTAVAVYASNGNLLCEVDRFYADPSNGLACAFERNRLYRLDYKIRVNELNSGTLMDSHSGTIVKDATYNFPPEAALVSDRVVTPPRKDKALHRGQYWQASVQAVVKDQDVDPSENQSLIKVELVQVFNGYEKVIKTQHANSGETVTFELEHQYIVPLAFGKPHESGDLQKGQNVLKVRVWDAYEGNTSMDLPEVTVNIQ